MSSKIKDGLFMGDVDAAQDSEFLQLNGIVHIINCVPRQVPNLFQQSLGLSYTPCDLDEVLRRPLFDLKNREFMGLVKLIDRSLEKTESVLVHSLHGLNRSPSLMIGYLMVKYCWGVDKAYDFIVTKRADIKLDESYAEQLCSLESQLQKTYPDRATEQQIFEWNPASVDPMTDELVLVHTFLNTTSKSNGNVTNRNPKKKQSTRANRWITWIDQSTERVLWDTYLLRGFVHTRCWL
uniref:Tyrosine-protein phosphatase domain-containing protein n=1 Tax=Globisporangium ultimum (strain ATCC 200006 / CBS 805.95 / DAOM BR144) TaxID=431595 RepID=K3W6J1_GLOUD